jgi:hypothetical protein
MALFAALAERDLLLIDTAHVAQVLPRLAPGVVVHVHDPPHAGEPVFMRR